MNRFRPLLAAMLALTMTVGLPGVGTDSHDLSRADRATLQQGYLAVELEAALRPLMEMEEFNAGRVGP